MELHFQQRYSLFTEKTNGLGYSLGAAAAFAYDNEAVT
jgi:hypothetical protein